MEVAHSVMETLLPQDPPQLEGFYVAVLHNPSRHVSGDYYDFIHRTREGRASDICRTVMEDLAAFNGARLADDRTLVIIKAV